MLSDNRFVRRILEFLQRSWREERAGRPGHINLALIALSAILVAAGAVLDLLQAVVRIFQPEYTTGQPSFLAQLAVFLLGGLLCMCFVGAISALRDRGAPPN